MAIHNIERCRDGYRTSLLIAGVVLVKKRLTRSPVVGLHHPLQHIHVEAELGQ